MRRPISQLFFQQYKTQIRVWIAVGVLVVIGQVLFYVWRSQHHEALPELSFETKPTDIPLLTDFNPNDLDQKGWERLGFSLRQAQTIIKYKNVVGGTFVSKAQLAKCYAISPEKFETLAPYILLPETATTPIYSRKMPNQQGYRLKIHRSFNPNDYSEADWVKLGLSPKQAQSIIKYQHYLGGRFLSKAQLKACYTLSSEHYAQLEPYLLLPEQAPEEPRHQASSPQKSKIQYANFDPNALDQEGWQKLGFSEKQAAVIIKYKETKLKGRFKNLEEIKNCFVISEEKFLELQPYIQLSESEQTAQQKAPEPERPRLDFSKIDLNDISAEQLQIFGFSPKIAQRYVAFRSGLGGFVHKNQVLEIYGVEEGLARQLLEVAPLETAKIKKYRLTTAPEAWLKRHPYFKRYADRIIFYRITYTDEAKILKMLNPKPEDWAKMKLYLE